MDSSPARGVHSLGQLPALVLGTTPGAQRGLSIPGSWLVGALLPPSRQVSRSTPCYQLDSPAGRGPGRAILTRSVSLPAPPWEPLSVVLEFWVWLPPGTSVFPVLSWAGLAKKLWLVRPWGGGTAGESGWRVGGCDQAVRQHSTRSPMNTLNNLLGPDKCVALPNPGNHAISYWK